MGVSRLKSKTEKKIKNSKSGHGYLKKIIPIIKTKGRNRKRTDLIRWSDFGAAEVVLRCVYFFFFIYLLVFCYSSDRFWWKENDKEVWNLVLWALDSRSGKYKKKWKSKSGKRFRDLMRKGRVLEGFLVPRRNQILRIIAPRLHTLPLSFSLCAWFDTLSLSLSLSLCMISYVGPGNHKKENEKLRITTCSFMIFTGNGLCSNFYIQPPMMVTMWSQNLFIF